MISQNAFSQTKYWLITYSNLTLKDQKFGKCWRENYIQKIFVREKLTAQLFKAYWNRKEYTILRSLSKFLSSLVRCVRNQSWYFKDHIHVRFFLKVFTDSVTIDVFFHSTSTDFFVVPMLNQNKFGENKSIRELHFKIKTNCQVPALKIKTNVRTLRGKNLSILIEKTHFENVTLRRKNKFVYWIFTSLFYNLGIKYHFLDSFLPYMSLILLFYIFLYYQ